MTFRFLSPAFSELSDAADYYEKQAGMGREFVSQVDASIERILMFPLAWGKISHDTHHCHLRKFPYTLIYMVRGDDELIIFLCFISDVSLFPGRVIQSLMTIEVISLLGNRRDAQQSFSSSWAYNENSARHSHSVSRRRQHTPTLQLQIFTPSRLPEVSIQDLNLNSPT